MLSKKAESRKIPSSALTYSGCSLSHPREKWPPCAEPFSRDSAGPGQASKKTQLERSNASSNSASSTTHVEHMKSSDTCGSLHKRRWGSYEKTSRTTMYPLERNGGNCQVLTPRIIDRKMGNKWANHQAAQREVTRWTRESATSRMPHKQRVILPRCRRVCKAADIVEKRQQNRTAWCNTKGLARV